MPGAGATRATLVLVRVLLVEDDDAIADPLVTGLERDGFTVARVASGGEALAAAGYDFVLLDLGLPDVDGTDVCRRIRAGSDVPIIVITARGDEIDRVLLLELGADDYIVKPFGLRELVARVRAVARRANGITRQTGSALELDGLRIDRRARRVTLNGEEVVLTPKEFDLLSFLASEPGAVLSRQEILETVWDAHWYGPTKTLDVHIAALRKKLLDPRWIETVRGVGFRLSVPQ
jgi:DNA-binding response OmpR family regulator